MIPLTHVDIHQFRLILLAHPTHDIGASGSHDGCTGRVEDKTLASSFRKVYIERNTDVTDKSRHHSFAGSLLCLGEESVNMRVHGREGDDNLGRIVVMGVAEM